MIVLGPHSEQTNVTRLLESAGFFRLLLILGAAIAPRDEAEYISYRCSYERSVGTPFVLLSVSLFLSLFHFQYPLANPLHLANLSSAT